MNEMPNFVKQSFGDDITIEVAYVNKHVGEKLFLEKKNDKELWKIDGHLHVIALCCECDTKFMRKCSRKILNVDNIYCCKDCLNESQRNGKAKAKKENHFLVTYGVTNPGAIDSVKQRKKITFFARYGVDNCSKIPEVKLRKSVKMKRLCKETDFLEKCRRTSIEHYGSHYLATSQARTALKEYALKTYGVNHCMKSMLHLEERKSAFLKRHNVENPLQLEEVKQKIRQTCLKRYGVDNVFKRPEVIDRRIKKLVENAKRFSSDGEDKLYDVLCDNFENVERHNCVFYRKTNFWIIDFKIGDLYVQYDGIYWHGIGKNIIELKALLVKGDKSAKMQIKAINRDRYQDRWFAKNNMKLFRVIEGTPIDVTLQSLKEITNAKFC